MAKRNITKKTQLSLEKIEKLQDGWDGGNAQAFTKEVINSARILSKYLVEDFCIYPTTRGSIQLEYKDVENNTYIEFEVHSDGRTDVLCTNPTTHISIFHS